MVFHFSQEVRIVFVLHMSAASQNKKNPSPQGKKESAGIFRSMRELVESLAIALFLAFLFKAFAVEAYVIPTGSMASTLMGRHKDINCEKCKFRFQISASEESNDGSASPRAVENLGKVLAGTCPQCRWTNYTGADNPEKKIILSYNGDRIFVNKSIFDFKNPARWHVTVFRYPGGPQINYIKRLVGLENETIRIRHGDIFVKKEGETDFTIQRKPLRNMLAMLRPVENNDYVQPELLKTGWQSRWFTENEDEPNQWHRSADYKSFDVETSSADGKPAWLHFRNIIPSSEQWYALAQNRLPENLQNTQQLVTDFVGYDSGIVRSASPGKDNSRYIFPEGTGKKYFCAVNPEGMGLNWVGDLAISCRLTVNHSDKFKSLAGLTVNESGANLTGRRPLGLFLLRLVKGGKEFLCRINIDSGEAELLLPDNLLQEQVKAQTPVRAGESFDIMFCNIDEELRLIVNGKEIDFNGKNRYDSLCGEGGALPRDRAPTAEDLTPASFGAVNASVKIEHLTVQRDLYYIACDANSTQQQCDLLINPYSNGHYWSTTENTVHTVLSTPELWKHFGKTNTVEITLGKDEFMMLGDNSAKSQDSRLWTTAGIPPSVNRELLIGEAILVYWPHGFRIPGTRLALVPNIFDMRIID
ncbi:MAG: S26 family signal peptidase [Planctomycetaceae bacterium]|nr:S26 family signal peptidase [Planctomycetaceae bacterium]